MITVENQRLKTEYKGKKKIKSPGWGPWASQEHDFKISVEIININIHIKYDDNRTKNVTSIASTKFLL